MLSVRAPPSADCAMKSSSVTPARLPRRLFVLAIETLAALRDLARRRRVLDDEQLIARHRHALKPRICTGIAGPACLTGLPRSSNRLRTRPEYMLQMKSSPTLSVPFCTSTVATGPCPDRATLR
jgi:hypothetical protein